MNRYYSSFPVDREGTKLIEIDVRAIVAFETYTESDPDRYLRGEPQSISTRLWLAGVVEPIYIASNKATVIGAIERAFDDDEAATFEASRE